MFTNIALLSLAVMSASGAPSVYRPRVELWTNRGDAAVYTRGERVRLYFRLDQDAYVTIFRVDTDGRVRVLFPREPWEDNFARGGRDFEVDGNELAREAFTIDDYPGVGYLFAVASADAFVYDGVESGDHWDYRVIADGRVRGDPYVAMTDLAQRIVPEGYTDWDYDVISYNVGQHYDYPRFLCYDCHTYVSYSSWSPYDYTCVRFRIVVFDDPYYYPYRYYGDTRVVFTRPYRPEPRFIFKDRQASDAFITRVRERPVNDDRRRDVGVRGRDLGGTGVIPPPNIQPPRRRPGSEDQGNDDRGRDRRRDQPDHRDRPDQPDHRDRPDQPDHRDRPDQPEHRDRPDQPEHRDRPEQPDHRDRPDQPDHRDEPGRPERRDRPDQPNRPEQPVQPPAQPERRAVPEERRRADPPPRRAEPRREAPPPRSEPRVEPKREPPKEKPRAEPELKRRKP